MRSCQASSKKARRVRESPLQKAPYELGTAAGLEALTAREDGAAAGAMGSGRRQPRVTGRPRGRRRVLPGRAGLGCSGRSASSCLFCCGYLPLALNPWWTCRGKCYVTTLEEPVTGMLPHCKMQTEIKPPGFPSNTRLDRNYGLSAVCPGMLGIFLFDFLTLTLLLGQSEWCCISQYKHKVFI